MYAHAIFSSLLAFLLQTTSKFARFFATCSFSPRNGVPQFCDVLDFRREAPARSRGDTAEGTTLPWVFVLELGIQRKGGHH